MLPHVSVPLSKEYSLFLVISDCHIAVTMRGKVQQLQLVAEYHLISGVKRDHTPLLVHQDRYISPDGIDLELKDLLST